LQMRHKTQAVLIPLLPRPRQTHDRKLARESEMMLVRKLEERPGIKRPIAFCLPEALLFVRIQLSRLLIKQLDANEPLHGLGIIARQRRADLVRPRKVLLPGYLGRGDSKFRPAALQFFEASSLFRVQLGDKLAPERARKLVHPTRSLGWARQSEGMSVGQLHERFREQRPLTFGFLQVFFLFLAEQWSKILGDESLHVGR